MSRTYHTCLTCRRRLRLIGTFLKGLACHHSQWNGIIAVPTVMTSGRTTLSETGMVGGAVEGINGLKREVSV